METLKMSNKEKEILETLLKAQRPLTKREIVEQSPNRSWKETSLHGLLNSLMEKEIVAVDDVVQIGTHFGRTYKSVYSREEYTEMLMDALQLDRKSLFSYFVKEKKLTAQEIAELKDVVDNY